ncbi:nucleoside recognition domain-containing protein [Paenibacillus mucilaginosus]|uniref:Sporulation integral membrane protein YlbJ n=1 Tax=Paenibacillus mucilaginosus (strain KNP414) TaxID=1036673 RepID=F8F9R3_PAEMK|nr:nucleoside recognition domain-containing protein [Paenibacillus mucilaginosus]AEI44392.1 sporulation integral membrane protein YlbJ [Paenibacillus mucilaginosus KNP414]MCG7213771.1 sporulation protein [Paenibacillus mucilaginosus]WDM25783.1 sporulation protein [Paenibacillus mucilaginosus]
MHRLQALLSPRLATLFLGMAALALVASIIAFPDGAFQASLQGLHLWWKLVFPALLPFLIATELLRGMGVLHGLGALLDPLLRLLFRLPGAAGWPLALGFTAGMPAGASAVGPLRKDGLLQREEAERLLAGSHLMSPVFLVAVVGTGFLQSPSAGLALALLHYVSGALVMLWHRLNSPSSGAALPGGAARRTGPGWLRHAWEAYHDAKARDGRTFGKLLGDSVSSGVQQLFLIGGAMMMFSVLLHALNLSGLPSLLASALSLLGIAAPEAKHLASALLAGVLEPHLGAYALSQAAGTTSAPLPYALLGGLLAWGGFSTHAQVKSLTASTDLRYSRFLLARLQHAGTAFFLTLGLWQPLMSRLHAERPAFADFAPAAYGWSLEQDSLWPLVSPMMLQFGTALLVMLVLSVFAAFLFYRGQDRESL